MSMAANAQTSDNTLPERLYIVGTMNNWMVPSENPDCDAYSLTDDDADGIYEGSFEIDPGQLNFKVFDAEADWSSPENYFGTSVSALPMFSGETWRLELNAGPNFLDVCISNWAGGTLSLQAAVDDSGDTRKIILTGSGSNQPDPTPRPETVYINGTFNDWKLPEGDNTNGTLALEQTSYGLYQGTVKFPEGTNSFAVNYLDPETRQWVKLLAFKDQPPFTLQRYEGFEYNASYMLSLTNPEFSDCVEPILRDWNGTEITFTFSMADPIVMSLHLESKTANSIAIPQAAYLQYSVDGGEWGQIETPSISPKINPGKEFRMNFMAQETEMVRYGVMAGYDSIFTYDADYFNSHNIISVWIPIEKDGQTIEIKSQENLALTNAYINFESREAMIYFTKTEAIPDHLYLIGSLGEGEHRWNIEDDSMELQNLGDGVFYGEFPVSDPDDVMFRFYTRLGAWGDNGDRYIYGANPDDGANVAISIPYSGTMTYGKGNWSVTNFTGEKLRVEVNTNDMTLSVSNESGIRYIGSSDSKSIEGIYDLNGLRHSTLQRGINLVRYTDGSVSKVAR